MINYNNHAPYCCCHAFSGQQVTANNVAAFTAILTHTKKNINLDLI